MSGRQTETTTQRLKRHRIRVDLGEWLIDRCSPLHLMNLEELRSVQSAYSARTVRDNVKVRRLDPRSPQRRSVQEQIEQDRLYILRHVEPLLSKALEKELRVLIKEHREGGAS